MKTIGLIGGMSWESTTIYYQLLNKTIKETLGGFHSAKCIVNSVDFAEIERLQHSNYWDGLNKCMVTAAKQLENAGADLMLLCTNTMHLCSDEIIKNISIPFLHIADVTAIRIKNLGLKKVALLGTKFTMEKDFYKNALSKYDIETIIPDINSRDRIHRIIYDELVLGHLNPSSKKEMLGVISQLHSKGAEGVILGCTEIPLLIKKEDVDIHVFDTTAIHAESAVKHALQTNN